MKKKVFAFVVALAIACGLWCWYSANISNPWNAKTIGDIPVPFGYTRIEAPSGSYAEFLRSLQLCPKGTKVSYYTGEESGRQYLSTAVVDKKILCNSEQCADVTIHLRAEYLWQKGRYSEISFRNVNGKRMNYTGGSSRKAFEKYLRNVYGWCSTYSVYHETTPRSILDVQPGDVLVYAARSGHQYGHAIIVVDVAKRSDGKVAVLLAEGNTPARDIHVFRNLNPLENPWFFFDGTENTIKTSGYHFNKDEVRHY